MNIALFGYILAWLGVIYCIITVIATYNHYKSLTTLQQKHTTIEMGKPLLILVASVAYLATYHIS